MKGCFKGNLLQAAAFLAVFLIILLGFRLAGVRDEARIKNEAERIRSLLSQEEFLLRLLDEAERGAEGDWLNEAERHGLTGYVSVRRNGEYGGVYLVLHQGFPSTTGFLVTREPVRRVIDKSSTRLEVCDRGEKVFIYRLTFYWD